MTVLLFYGNSTGVDTKKLGELGENIACEYLVNKGYKVMGKNYRINFGEIDIIAKKGFRIFAKDNKVIHFIEVKTIIDSGAGFFPEERVDRKKQQKLRRLSEIWLEKNNFPQNYPYQIDIIGILINKNTRNAKVHYFQNVVEDIY